MALTLNTTSWNLHEIAYLCSWGSLGKASANGLFDIQNTGKIGPAPLILRGQSLAMFPSKGLSCVRYSYRRLVADSLLRSPERRPPMMNNQDLR